MSVRALDFDREDDELPREEALLEEALREDDAAAERLLLLADLDAPLLLEPLVLLELPVEPLFDLLLPDRAPDERELLLFRDLLLDFEGMGISFFLFLCDESARASGCQSQRQLPRNILPLLGIATCCVVR